MLPELFIQQLKQSCDMERIVSGYLPLKKKGRYLGGLCPFHSEKSPSFYVYPQNQSFYCFGCGAGGEFPSVSPPAPDHRSGGQFL